MATATSRRAPAKPNVAAERRKLADELLGIHRNTLTRKMGAYKIKK